MIRAGDGSTTMDAAGVTELYARIFAALDEAVEEDWERIAVNYEMEIDGDQLTEDRIGVAIVRDADGALRQVQVPFTEEAKRLFRSLSDAVLARDGQRPGAVDLLMDASGKYRFNFDFGAPRRIGGTMDDQAMRLARYVDLYRADPSPL
ncbi:hypothetical protein ACE7GA_24930 [Roseomonas sp. CCTCC AB2023176]|uniref:hypothetical protein n=1 Tax=Roseomonas sp. CCTCC AB2023176 TaxID=3342640 RepID=UPI0035E20E35